MPRNKILFLGGGIEGLEGVHWAKRNGYNAVVMDMNRQSPGACLADEFIDASVYHPDRALKAVKEYKNKDDIISVITIGHDVPHTVAEICQYLNLPGPSLETGYLSINKLAMKERLAERGIPIPWFSKIETCSELEQAVNKKSQLVLKPIDNRGARGVLKLVDGVDLKWAFNYSMKYSNTKILILEEWIDGPQITTESLVWDEKTILCGICDREYESTKWLYPTVIEGGSLTPTSLSEDKIRKIADVFHNAGKALGLKRGILKGDIVWGKSGPVIVEVTARLSGGYFCTHTIPLAFGVDIIEHAIKISMGVEPDWKKINPRHRQYVVSTCLFLPQGTIKKIEFKNDYHKQSWVAMFHLNVKEGDQIPPCTSHATRSGLAITTGETPEEAIERGRKLIDSINVTMLQ